MKEKEISVTSETINVSYIIDQMEALLKEAPFISDAIKTDIIIALDEAVTNVIMHSYEMKQHKDNKIVCKMTILDNEIKIEIRDQGKPFLPEEHKTSEFDINDDKKGGFGLLIMNKIMDNIDFQRDDNKSENILIMTKHL